MVTDDDHRLRGTFIAESLSRGAVLTNLGITVDTITRACLDSPAQGQPDTWTLIAFDADAAAGDQLAAAFAQSLNPGPWYVDFRSEDLTYVIFSRQIFTYTHGDGEGRARAVNFARGVGIPEDQLDWR